MNYNEKQARRFSFSRRRYDPATGEAVLSYEVDGRALHEIITFPWAPWPADASRQAAFLQALEMLHLVAGISYYKAGLAPAIHYDDIKVDEQLAGFLNALYVEGLAEFAWVNQLDLTRMIHFAANTARPPAPLDLDLPERALVAMGGGKDSLVCLHILRETGIEVQPACVGNSSLIGDTVKAANLPLLRIQRSLSPQLADMNAGGAWNGHVPVTAINSAILLCAGLLYGYRHVVFANEASANEATLVDGQGREVNHQYSKSLKFERRFRDMITARITPGLEYFSLLRPFNEITVARRFAGMREYHAVFSSCNRNFHQTGTRIEGRWCQDCPKCRFTALALALFMEPAQLTAIQGADLLDQADQLPGFRALCGLGTHKPFECVGSIAECRAAVHRLTSLPQWRRKRVVATLADRPEIQAAGFPDLSPDPTAVHFIPAAIEARLRAGGAL